MALITSTEQLKKYVSINASKDFATYEQYVIDAQREYLEPYVGYKLLEDIEAKDDDKLYILLCNALGPFSLAIATHELSIQFGESGHTVVRTDKLAPASEAKIEKAKESLFKRAWSNLDAAIKYLSESSDKYPLWESAKFANKLSTDLFENHRSLQENGLIDIDNSPLTFSRLQPLIKRIERTEVMMSLLPRDMKVDDIPTELMPLLQAYVGSRVAALHTSRNSHSQRANSRFGTEFTATIRPLFENHSDDMNYYNEQSQLYATEIKSWLVDNGDIDASASRVDWNDKDKKIFSAI